MSRTSRTLALLLWAMLPALPQSSESCTNAMAAQRAGNTAEAARLYPACLHAEPNRFEVRANFGVVLAALGRYDEAIVEYEKAQSAAPPQAATALTRNIALAYYKSGRVTEAAARLAPLQQANLGDRDLALLLSDCYLRLGQPEKAVAVLQPRREAARTDRALAYVLGMSLIQAGQTTEGQAILNPIFSDRNSAEAQYVIGAAAFTAGDYPEAVKAFAQAAELDPKLPSLFGYYGRALLFTGDPDAATQAFRRQLEIDPNDYDANFYLASILGQRKQPAEALPLFEKAVRLRPQSVEALFELASAQLAAGRAADAQSALEKLVTKYPDYGPAYERLAEAYTALNRPADAARTQATAKKLLGATKPRITPPIGTAAPEFSLQRAGGSGTASLIGERAGKPAVLVFGSYSCPNFRDASPHLNTMALRYSERAAFRLIYIREAHSTAQWQSTRNTRENVTIAEPTTLGARSANALQCTRRLKLGFPALVDNMQGTTEKAYEAWPSKVVVIGADGKIRYVSGLSELEFKPAELEAAIKAAL